MTRILLAWAVVALAAVAHAQALPVEEFFKRPDFSAIKLSPDGKRIAAIVRGGKRDALAVMNADTKKGQPVTNFSDADVVEFHWINDHRLAFRMGDARTAQARAEYYGWYAVNGDGTRLEEVRLPRPDSTRYRGYVAASYVRYIGPDPTGGERMLIEARTPQWLNGQRLTDEVTVWRWDSLNANGVNQLGKTELTGATGWLLDQRGVVRMAKTHHEGREKIWYRDAVDSPWRILEDAAEGELSFYPVEFDFDDKTLYVAAYGGGDKLGIYRYDVAKNRLGEGLARHLDVDMFEVVSNRARRQLLGIKYNAERRGAVWLDEQMARMQQMVNRALPNTANDLELAEENPNRALVTAYSDVAPTVYYIFDAEKRTLNKLASSRPWIKPGDMSERKLLRYKARDGMEIPAYLTIPKGSSGKNLPLVVEIHSGPWEYKQSWQFDPAAQFLAARGYAVLQPDYRGTFGYGKRHYEASFGQWGLSMQDDITDGVQSLVEQGIVDKNRICLYGAGYGGYAALWGLMKTPELYRCGVALGAYTDVGAYFNFNRWDWGRAVWSQYGARKMIGDPGRDAEKLMQVSPVAQAQRLKVPVLIAHGDFDQRVPVKEANAFRNELDRYGKKYEWVVYPEEGHGFDVYNNPEMEYGFSEDRNRFDFFRRVEHFLQQHLSTGAAAKQQ